MPSPSRRAVLASAALFAAGRLSAADLPVTGPADANLAPFDDLLAKLVADHELPGAAAAVTRAGRLVYARGFGFADAAKKVAVRPDAPFRIASVSKPVTAAAILLLVDRGKVALDDAVLKHVALEPFLPGGGKVDPQWAKVTVRQCLQHTGGWDRDRKKGFDPISIPAQITKEMKLAGPPTPDEIVRYMLGRPLDFAPGDRMAYSNLGYLLLGRVIEAATGQKYEPWVKANVLAPVGAAGMALARALPENRAKGEVGYHDSEWRTGRCLYPPRANQRVPLPDGAMNVEAFEAHGGWVASAVDLVRFATAFDGGAGALLSADARAAAWARPSGAAGTDKTGKPRAAYYGCGWSVRPIGKGGRVNAWHDGLIPGTNTLLVRRFDGLTWAVLFNSDATVCGDYPSSLVDGPMHAAADAVKTWPEGDLFEKFPPGK